MSEVGRPGLDDADFTSGFTPKAEIGERIYQLAPDQPLENNPPQGCKSDSLGRVLINLASMSAPLRWRPKWCVAAK
jgi:hypothetical protein